MTKPTTKELAKQWTNGRGGKLLAAQTLRRILEGKAKCDDQSRQALAFLVEEIDPTLQRVQLPAVQQREHYGQLANSRCGVCSLYLCDCCC